MTTKEYNRIYRLNNAVAIKAKRDANKAANSIYQKAYREANKDKAKEYRINYKMIKI
jgi:hypothetical protein